MGCCGERRAAARADRGATTSSSVHAEEAERWATASVRYRERHVLRLRGPRSRTYYEFSPERSIQLVYRIDVPHLLQSGLFELVSR